MYTKIDFEPDVDYFFTCIYKYFIGKGWRMCILTRVLELLQFIIIFTISFVVIDCVDWEGLQRCSVNECNLLSFVNYPQFGFYSILYMLCGACYALWLLFNIISDVGWITKYYKFYLNVLNINSEIGEMCWDDVVMRLIEVNDQHKFCSELTPQIVAMYILRSKNYGIALYHNHIVTFDYGLPCTLFFFYNKIMKIIFTPTYKLTYTANELRSLIKMCAVTHILFTPLVLIYVIIIKFLFEDVSIIYHNPMHIAAKEWTNLALLKFSEYNELPHVFKKRIFESKTYADEYWSLAPKSFLQIISKFLETILNTFFSVMLFIGLMNTDLLFHVVAFNKHLLWYIGVCTACIAMFKSFNEERVFPRGESEVLEDLNKTTRTEIKNFSNLKEMYTYKFLLLIEDVFSVITTPLTLYKLSNEADDIISFIQENTCTIEIGDVCSYSMFTNEINYDVSVVKGDISQLNKVERSYLNFVEQHPSELINVNFD